MTSSPFRSEDMMLCQLYLQAESGYSCVAELGELGVVEFRDLNEEENLFSREHVSEVRRAEEMLRKLRYLEKEIEDAQVAIPSRNLDYDAPLPGEIADLESTFEKLEEEIVEVNNNADALRKNFFELNEFRTLLKYSGEIFDEPEHVRSQMVGASHYGAEEEEERIGAHVGFVAGTLPRERLATFELLLWRACRGNVFLKVVDVPGEVLDPRSGNKISKVIFAVFFQGEALRIRVTKICEGFSAAVYPVPEDPPERAQVMDGLVNRLEDLTTVLAQTEHYRYRVLNAAAKNLDSWFIRVQKMKAIYHTLNKFMYDFAPDCIVAECWIPTSSLEVVQKALITGMDRSGGTVPPIINRMETEEMHPTYTKTNRFTKGFQHLVDAYGVAEYKEMNPAIYAVITFPFLFGVMFGDVGHGLIMAIFGGYLVWKERTLESALRNNEIGMMFFGGRYIIMLMGIFAVYCGFIYNDCFGKPFRLFNSGYPMSRYDLSEITSQKEMHIDPGVQYRGYPYPFGLDPIWIMAHNKITYMNSFKMKTSIVLGVFQMLFGLVLSLTNHTYFRKPLNIWCEFVPQLLFMLCMFGYLVVLIIIKWVKFTSAQSSCAPSILITFINMAMMRAPPEIEGCSENTMFPGQTQLQFFLMILAVLCIPWMLFIKPFILRRRHQKSQQNVARGSATQEGREQTPPSDLYQLSPSFEAIQVQPQQGNYSLLQQSENTGQVIEVEPETGSNTFDFGEVMINQGIHSIEFVLGTISHTASYLRLWALSLAHAQLSEVLWGMIFRKGFTISLSNYKFNCFSIYILFAVWAVLTVGVLVLMEGLSAFLHTLRLHCGDSPSRNLILNKCVCCSCRFVKTSCRQSRSRLKGGESKEPKRMFLKTLHDALVDMRKDANSGMTNTCQLTKCQARIAELENEREGLVRQYTDWTRQRRAKNEPKEETAIHHQSGPRGRSVSKRRSEKAAARNADCSLKRCSAGFFPSTPCEERGMNNFHPWPWLGWTRGWFSPRVPPDAFLVPYTYCFKSPFCAFRSVLCFFMCNWKWLLQWIIFMTILYTAYGLVSHMVLSSGWPFLLTRNSTMVPHGPVPTPNNAQCLTGPPAADPPDTTDHNQHCPCYEAIAKKLGINSHIVNSLDAGIPQPAMPLQPEVDSKRLPSRIPGPLQKARHRKAMVTIKRGNKQKTVVL